MEVNKQQIKTIYALLAKQGKKKHKDDIVLSWTEGRSSHVSEMTSFEADSLIYYLRYGVRKDYAHYALFDSKNKKHMYILSLAHQTGWVSNLSDGRRVADLRKLGHWIASRSATKKPLKKQTAKELQTTIYQLEQVLKYNISK